MKRLLLPIGALLFAVLVSTPGVVSAMLAVPHTTQEQCDSMYNNLMAQCYGWQCSGKLQYDECIEQCGISAGYAYGRCAEEIDPGRNVPIACTIVNTWERVEYAIHEDCAPNPMYPGEWMGECDGVVVHIYKSEVEECREL